MENKVKELLLKEWDPIGVKDDPNANLEYNQFVIPVGLYLGELIKEYRACLADPEECARSKSYDRMKKEIERNEQLNPGQCKPPAGPNSAPGRERRVRKA